MPFPFAAAAAGIAAVGLISGFIASKKASKAAKEEAAEQARLEGMVTDEKIRTLGIDERTLYGETVSGYARGGVQAVGPTLGGGALPQTGTPQTVLGEQAREFAYQKDITQKVGATKAQAALTRGKNVADAYRWSGYANVASGISNILTSYAATKN